MKLLDYFKTLSDETRVRALNILMCHEMSVNEVAETLGLGQSGISRHLRTMAEAGLLTVRRDGLWAFYSVPRQGPGREFIDAVRYLFEGEAGLAEDLVRAGRVVDNRSRETRSFFNSIAGNWSDMRREILQGLDLAAEIAARMPACEVAADLGCGAGDLLPVLQRKARSVIGVDSSPEMIAEARRRLGVPENGISLRIGELEHLPLRDGEADFALESMVLHHLSAPAAGIREAFRVLSPGGSFMVVDFLRHGQEVMRTRYGDRWLGFEAADMERWLQEAGFTIGMRARFDLARGLHVVLYQAQKPAAESPAPSQSRRNI